MLWDAVEAALKSHITTAWAAGAYPSVPLIFDNEKTLEPGTKTFVAVNFEGTFTEKGIYGSVGNRLSLEGGIVFFHVFVPAGSGKAAALAMNVALAAMIELQLVSTGIYLEGANPPSPVDYGDQRAPSQPPVGNIYRCSGSVPFIVTGNR
jgi:hypothetical protein